ncbi:MAG TPA: putative glycolipid-binding domain-containing protein [Thermoleophilaceae bacterium]|nr:putative glycolipid-binding domain-containing protein [Thermoleophilaceae bacterium]
MTTSRVLLWCGLDEWRAECVSVALHEDRLEARGIQLGSERLPYRLDYELDTGPGFVTTRLLLTATGDGWSRGLDLRRDGDGAWQLPGTGAGAEELGAPGGDPGDLEGALDCDLAFSPLTNFMPIRRDAGGPADYSMAWVSVPDLRVHRAEQRYEPLGERRVRYSDDTGFTADLELDDEGFVERYPGLAQRV